jgi:hypothetical protein
MLQDFIERFPGSEHRITSFIGSSGNVVLLYRYLPDQGVSAYNVRAEISDPASLRQHHEDAMKIMGPWQRGATEAEHDHD